MYKMSKDVNNNVKFLLFILNKKNRLSEDPVQSECVDVFNNF